MKAYEVLDRPNKWRQGLAAIVKDKACIAIAIDRAYPGEDKRILYKRVAKSIGLTRDDGYDALDQLIHWNDAPERTFEEVRDALIKADV